MKKEDMLDSLIIPFISEMIAVVLGIVITFAGQEKIDAQNEKEGIQTELASVVKELNSNMEDLQQAHLDILDFNHSAKYLLSNINHLGSCPSDSVLYHWDNLKSESYLTLPEDALMMLKSTYLYSDMLDREVALAVVRAYDICSTLERTICNISEKRTNSMENIEEFFLIDADRTGRLANVNTRISSFQSRKLLQTVAGQTGFWIDNAIMDINDAISIINDFIEK